MSVGGVQDDLMRIDVGQALGQLLASLLVEPGRYRDEVARDPDDMVFPGVEHAHGRLEWTEDSFRNAEVVLPDQIDGLTGRSDVDFRPTDLNGRRVCSGGRFGHGACGGCGGCGDELGGDGHEAPHKEKDERESLQEHGRIVC